MFGSAASSSKIRSDGVTNMVDTFIAVDLIDHIELSTIPNVQVDAARKKSNYIALLAHFYHRHPTQFVTAYAASSPEEDLAETWAYFVLNPKPRDDSMAHKKVLFFYDFPELVNLRNQIATNVCAYAASQ